MSSMEEGKERNGAVGNIQDGNGEGYTKQVDYQKLIASPGEGDSQQGEVEPLQLEAHDHGQDHQKTSEGLKIIIVSSITFAIGITVALIVTIYCAPPQLPPHGSVACDAPMCAAVGSDILKKGGSAVDAAIATTLCAGVVHPVHSGIGGGMLMVFRQHKAQTSDVIDGREVAPQDATQTMYNGNEEDQKVGVRSIAVPGELRGLAKAHELHGKLTWKELVMPAVEIARNGFNVTGLMANRLKERVSIANVNANFKEFYFPGGVPLEKGAFIRNPLLADTLELIANEGVEVFYNGSVGKIIAQEIAAENKGGVTQDDLNKYEALVRQPLQGDFLDFTVETMPAPGSGPLLVFLLNYMEGYLAGTHKSVNETAVDIEADTELFYHRLLEGIKFSEALRIKFGDPAFDDAIKNMTNLITSKVYSEELRNKTDDTKTQDPGFYGTAARSGATNTAQISVIGTNEDHVSITTSINTPFGSGFLTSNGVLLNNQMFDFDLPGGAAVNPNNLIAPGKRPLSSMTPTLVHSRERPCGLRLAIGGTNGTRIVSGIAEVLINLIHFNIPLHKAIDDPRIFSSLDPVQVEYDGDFPQNILDSLKAKGHGPIVKDVFGVNTVTVASKANETVLAHADKRTPGEAVVF